MTPRTLGAAGWAAVLGLLGARVALLDAPAAPGTFDECSFQAALSAWDLLAFEPHFPGYPLTVLGARLLAAAGAGAPYAALAALLLPLAALALWRGAGGGAGGVLAAGLFALAPLLAREAALPMADATGAALLAMSLGLAAAWRGSPRAGAAAAVGLLGGLAAGAKPDLLPWLALGLPLLLGAPPAARARLALAWGLAAALPLGLATGLAADGAGGWGPLLREGRRFVGGHLFEWGGGVAAPAHGPRLALLLPLGEATGAVGPTACGLGLALLLALAARAPRALRRGTLLAGLPYALWAVLAQNPDHPRHALPLLAPLALLAGAGLERLPARPGLRRALAAALLLGAASGLHATHAAAARPRPADTLCAWAGRLDPLQTRLYAGATGRVLRARLPALDVRRTRDLAGLRADLQADPHPPPQILVASEVPGAEALPVHVELAPGLRVHTYPGERSK